MPSSKAEREARLARRRAKIESGEVSSGDKSLWESANAPMWEGPSKLGRAVGDWLDPTEGREHLPFMARNMGMAMGPATGAKLVETAGDLISGLTSPVNLALTAATMGSGTLARLGFGGGSAALTNIARVGGGAQALHGGYTVARALGDEGKTTEQRATEALMGGLEMAGGAYGAMTPKPRVTPRSSVNPVARPRPQLQLGAPHPESPMVDLTMHRSEPRFYDGSAGVADADVRNQVTTRSGGYENEMFGRGTITPNEVGQVVDLPPIEAANYGQNRRTPSDAVFSGPEDPNVMPSFEEQLARLKAVRERGPIGPVEDLEGPIVSGTVPQPPRRPLQLGAPSGRQGTRFYEGPAGMADADVVNQSLTRSGLTEGGPLGAVIDPLEAASGRMRRQSMPDDVFSPGMEPSPPPQLGEVDPLAGAKSVGRGRSKGAVKTPKAPKVAKTPEAVVEPAPPPPPDVVDPKRPFVKTSQKDLEYLARAGSEEAARELKARRSPEVESGIGKVEDIPHIDEQVTPNDLHPDPDRGPGPDSGGTPGAPKVRKTPIGAVSELPSSEWQRRVVEGIDPPERGESPGLKGVLARMADETGAVTLDPEGLPGGRKKNPLGEVADVGEAPKAPESIRERLKREASEEAARTPRVRNGTAPPKAEAPVESPPLTAETSKKQSEDLGEIIRGMTGQGIFGRKDQNSTGMKRFADWINGRKATKVEGIVKRREFADLDELGPEAIAEYQKGKRDGGFQKVQDYFDQKHAWLTEQGVNLGFKENYLPQLWDNPKAEVQAVAKRLGLQPKFAVKSVIHNYEAGRAAGLTPKHKNISELIGWYEKTANKAVEDRKFYDWLKDNGLLKPKSKTPSDGSWASLDGDHFPVQKFVTKKGEETSQLLSAPKPVADLINNYLRDPTGKPLQWFADKAALSKNLAMSSGVPGTATSAHGFNMVVRNALARGLIKGTKEGVHWMVRPGAAHTYLENNLDKAAFFVKKGFTLTTEGFEIGEHSINKLAGGDNVLDKMTRKLLGWHDTAFEKPLFQKMIPALKLRHVQDVYAELMKTGLDSDTAARQASKITNDLYGGINWEAMGRNRDTQNILRAVFLAPDWGESTINMAKGLGKSALKKGSPEAKTYSKVAKNMLAAYVTANVVNAATTGKPMWENPPGHTFDVALGKSGDDYRWIRPFGTAADFARIPAETLGSMRKGDAFQAVNVVKNRFSTPVRVLGNIAFNTDEFGKKVWGRDVYGKDIPAWKEIANVGGQLSNLVTPPYVSNALKFGMGDQNLEESLMGSVEAPFRYSGAPKGKSKGRQGRSGRSGRSGGSGR